MANERHIVRVDGKDDSQHATIQRAMRVGIRKKAEVGADVEVAIVIGNHIPGEGQQGGGQPAHDAALGT